MKEFKHKLNMLWPGGKMFAISFWLSCGGILLYLLGLKKISYCIFIVALIIIVILVILLIIEHYQDKVLYEKNINEQNAINLGYNRSSFALPYRGTYIWIEHLDSMYGEKNLVVNKIKKDIKLIKANSNTSLVAINIDETKLDKEIAEFIYEELIKEAKDHITKLVFIVNDRKSKRIVNECIKKHKDKISFKINIMADFEKAKEWLTS